MMRPVGEVTVQIADRLRSRRAIHDDNHYGRTPEAHPTQARTMTGHTGPRMHWILTEGGLIWRALSGLARGSQPADVTTQGTMAA